MSKTEQEIPADDSEQDLRYLLLQLYLKNNPRLEHSVFIYSFQTAAERTQKHHPAKSGIGRDDAGVHHAG